MLRLLIFLGAAVCTPLLSAASPNVVVFLTDDQGWGDLSLSGNVDMATPNVDSLARDGASFDRFYVCPVCSPTRAEFLTGRHHARGGVFSTSAGGERLDLDEVTIADAFKAAGYATGAFGKWHNGMQYPYHPNGRGFDEFYGFCSGHWGDYFSPPLEHNGRIVKGEGFCVDDFTDKAMAFIEKSVEENKPFFTYVPYNTPHSPMQVPDRFWEKFESGVLKLNNEHDPDKENQTHKRAALAMCENLDWNVGRLLAKLDELKAAENTIVVWFHDNGPNGVRWNGGMKGRKGSTDEGGVRSPLLVRWPSGIKPGTEIPEICSARDLYPTLAELAGVPVAESKPLDGISLAPLLRGGAELRWPERAIISQWKKKATIRTQRYRLDNEGRLFDMIADPGQRTPVTKDHPAVASRLQGQLDAFRAEFMGEGYYLDERPFVIAHPSHEWTQLPARDGVAGGGIKRSNRFPNCSYFLNWKSTGDQITWAAEVAESGRFEVTLHYACRDADAGARVALSFRDSRLEFVVREGHEVPERGAENDRDVRSESYVKDWKEVVIGELELEKGPGILTLQALEIPGEEVMDFRLLMLRRLP